MAEQGAVVDLELGVCRQHAPVLRDGKRVDLGERAVGADIRVVELAQEHDGLVDDGRIEFGVVADLPQLVVAQAFERINRQARNRVRVFFGDGFDVHAAFRADDQHVALRVAVGNDAQIVLLVRS